MSTSWYTFWKTFGFVNHDKFLYAKTELRTVFLELQKCYMH